MNFVCLYRFISSSLSAKVVFLFFYVNLAAEVLFPTIGTNCKGSTKQLRK